MKIDKSLVLESYRHFVDEVFSRIYGNEKFEDICLGIRGHRDDRLIDMYLLRDNETFWSLYAEAESLFLLENYNRVITLMFTEISNNTHMRYLLDIFRENYKISEEMVMGSVDLSELKQTEKGLFTFITKILRDGV